MTYGCLKYDIINQYILSYRLDSLPADGSLEMFDEYKECISDIAGFDYIWVITLMHLNAGFKHKIRPQPVEDADSQPPRQVGLFSSRAPHRPNPIALSALKVVNVNVTAGVIEVRGLDLLGK